MDEISKATSNKFKSYLIDKLLNKQPQALLPISPDKDKPLAQSYAIFSLPPQLDAEKENKLDQADLNESKEDLHSEAGTYTIEDTDEENNLDTKMDSTLLDATGSPKKNQNATNTNTGVNKNSNSNILRQSTVSTNVDLVSARAAIDETFGIIKRPQINDNIDPNEPTRDLNTLKMTCDTSNTNSDTISTSQPLSPVNASRSRARNQTFSLKNEINMTSGGNDEIIALPKTQKTAPINSSFSTSSSSSVSSSITASSSVDGGMGTGLIKKTTTYEILAGDIKENGNDSFADKNAEIPNGISSYPASGLSSSRTVGTELLLGEIFNVKNSGF